MNGDALSTGLVTLKPLIALVFILVYVGLIMFNSKRLQVVWGAVGVLFLAIVPTAFGFHLMQGVPAVLWDFLTSISWNVLGIFTGMSIIAYFFIESKVPAWLADWFIARSKTTGIAMLWLCGLSGAISAFVDNVATVLIVAPIALAIAKRLNVSPVSLLIGIAISSNLQGTATLIGDPPSMITGAFISQQGIQFGFNEFFWFLGRPGMFFAVQFGGIFGFIVLYFYFRKFQQPAFVPEPIKIESMVPTYILLGVISSLAVATKFDPNFSYFGGTAALIGGTLGMIWHHYHQSKTDDGAYNFQKGLEANLHVLKHYDTETPLFLSAIFILVGLVDKCGLVTDIATGIQALFGQNLFVTYTVIVWMSVVLSGFIDNIPYIMVMLPVTAKLGEMMSGTAHSDVFILLAFGLLIGACLGGNCTPVGASANVVTIGLLKKQGYEVTFPQFMKMGIPFTVAATLAGYVFIWLLWS